MLSRCIHRQRRTQCTSCSTGMSDNVNAPSRNDETGWLRRRLKYFFMNPCQKFLAKRKVPWKLMLQLVKVVLVTVQLIMFGISRSSHVEFIEKSNVAFKHLFLKDWNAGYETMPYPPSMGAFAVYTIPDFYATLNFALNEYSKVEQKAIGTYQFTLKNNTMDPPQLCKRFYRQGSIFAFNESFNFDPTIDHVCLEMHPVNGTNAYDTLRYLELTQNDIDFDRLIDVELRMSLKTVHLRSLSQLNPPDCYLFDLRITFHNEYHNGQMTVDLVAHETPLTCHGNVAHEGMESIARALMSLFDTVVIVASIASVLLCTRSVYRALRLGKETVAYFASGGRQPLTWVEKLEFVNFWYLLIIFNDVLTIAGCFVKILIENKICTLYELCGVLLGTANLLVWCGVLRYLGFFRKYNILIRTIKRSTPDVLRFLLCAFVFYFGFAICGWVVLGPYHIKFRHMSTASECLFSLINGDDIFTTFATMSNVNDLMWWYSRIYLYFFVSLFIYVILSVFISVIMDTYETLKREQAAGETRNRLRAFAKECPDDPRDLFADESGSGGQCVASVCGSCVQKLSCCRSVNAAESETQEPNECSALLS